MKSLVVLLIPAVLLAGSGGFLIGALPSMPKDFQGSGLTVIWGGYGIGGSWGGFGFGGEGTFGEYVYSVGLGGALFGKSFQFGSSGIRIAVGFGGGGEELSKAVSGGASVEDFESGSIEGYLSIVRGFFFASPLLMLGFEIGKVSLNVTGGVILDYSIEGWKTELGKAMGIGKGFQYHPFIWFGLGF